MLVLNRGTVQVGSAVLLKEVSVNVRPGEVVAVVGPNGAGKTTLLRLMSGEWNPSSGSVLLDGRPLQEYPLEHMARQRAVMPQESTLAFDFSVLEVVLLGRTPHKTGQAHNVDVACRAMQAAGVIHMADRRYQTLSGGERQRVHLARALAQIWDAPGDGRSCYLLLDEPTASLDLAFQHHVLSIARRCAAEGAGVMAVLHDLNLAAQYADRIAVLSGGQLVADGPADETLTADIIEQAFDIQVIVTAHPCRACPLVVPVPYGERPAAQAGDSLPELLLIPNNGH
jgi:iron complex transport system ATP-binding protein